LKRHTIRAVREIMHVSKKVTNMTQTLENISGHSIGS
jgi:hypothetical protein